MPHQNFDSEFGWERRARIRREVDHDRLSAARPGQGDGREKAVSSKNLFTRGASVVVTPPG